MRTIQLLPNLVAESPGQLVDAVLAATDRQVADKAFEDPVAVAEFVIACDTLNLHRLIWRLSEEWGVAGVEDAFVRLLKSEVCRRRRYDLDEFESAMQATRARARLPFGWTALELARFRAAQSPIRLLPPDVANSRLATEMANVARHLQVIQEGKPILLPVEQLREMFSQRKVVVAGTVTRLVEAGLLDCVDANYHTGKAREYLFTGKEHEHWEELVLTEPERAAT